jgi:imidazoleglycerol-phosphate dehydratase
MARRTPSKGALVRLTRRTSETEVSVELGPPGMPGEVEVDLPAGLLRHALESWATWAEVRLRLSARGDDPHHRLEDSAIVLGRALREASGRGPVQRVADATVPMDDALVHVAVDLADRPFLAISDGFPLDVQHFLRSLTNEARWTLHIRVLAGEDEHHRVEATFKALGLAWALAMTPRSLPRSRKGAVEWETR